VDAGTQRQTIYTNLRPGQYRFLVQAEGEDLTWTPVPSALTVTVLPALHQQPLFFVVLALAIAGLGWAAWTARLRIVEHRFSLALAERARLSREMHDTLLQNLVGFALQLDDVAATQASPSARERLVGMRKHIERQVREVRQSIWDLRSPTLRNEDLASALRDAGDRLARGSALFLFSAHGPRRRLDPGRERHLLRIGQEAITNAVRHAAATRVTAELRYLDREVLLRVTDNGRGFDPAAAEDNSRHYGIVSMRERAAEIDGHLDIASSSGKGTTVEVRVPAA
jgi:signal transduction histidine kinase